MPSAILFLIIVSAASSFDNYDVAGSATAGTAAGRDCRRDFPSGLRQATLGRTRHHSAYQHGLASPQRVDNTGSFGGGVGDLVYGQSSSGLLSAADYDTAASIAAASASHNVRGIHAVKCRAAQQKLQQQQLQQQQQPGSGPLSANRMRTLTMSTPHLTQHPKHAHFNFVNHLAVRDQTAAHRGSAAVRASSMEPAPHSHRQQLQQQQQQQQRSLASAAAAAVAARGAVSAHASPASRRAAGATSFGGIYGARYKENGGAGYRVGTSSTAASASASFLNDDSLEAACLGPPKFVTDTSPMWYMPDASRDDAIQYLRAMPPGRFIVRDSHSYPGGYGLAVKVAEVPKGAPVRSEDRDIELVRHFLIEPTSKGVRLKGCPNEPVFASLAALIYQHTVTPLALPCKLTLPPLPTSAAGSATALAQQQQLPTAELVAGMDPMQILAQGAACNVLYLGAVDLESLTGPGGIAKAVDVILRCRDRLRTSECQFKVARDGITITDTSRKLFFRKHFPTACITHCGLDPHGRIYQSFETRDLQRSKIFGFIARKSTSGSDHTGVIVTEIEDYQPAEAVIQFVCKYLISGRGALS